MYSDENYIKITKIKDNESIEIHQNYVRLRESTHNKLMAFNIKAPLFETAEIERFFDGFNSSEKLKVNILRRLIRMTKLKMNFLRRLCLI